MAAPVIASSTSDHDTSTSTSREVSYPSGLSSGDWVLLFASIDANRNVLTPSGFTEVYYMQEPGALHATGLYKRKADGTEGATFTLENDSSEYVTWGVLRITGASSTDCIDVLSSSFGELGKQPYARCPNAWAESDESLILRMASIDGIAVNLANPSGHTSILIEKGSSSGVSISLSSKTQATAGYTDSAYFTSSNPAEEYIGLTVVIRSTDTPAALPAYPIIRSMSVGIPPSPSQVDSPLPYGTEEGDLLVVLRAADGPVVSLGGYTSAVSADEGTCESYIDYKVATSSEPATLRTISASSADISIFARITGADPDSPINVTSSNTGSSASPTSASLTTTADNPLLLWLGVADDDDIDYDTGYPSGYTGMVAMGQQEGSDVTMIFAIKDGGTAGTQAAASGSLTASEGWAVVVAAIAPAEVVTGVSGASSASLVNASGSASASSEATGSTSAGLLAATASATGGASLAASASPSLDDATASATGSLIHQGVVTATLANDTNSASASLRVSGASSSTDGTATSSASGTVSGSAEGTASAVVSPASATATGAATTPATASITLADSLASITGSVAVHGSFAVTAGNAASEVGASISDEGSVGVTTGQAVASADGEIKATGTSAVLLNAATAVTSGQNVAAGESSATVQAATTTASALVGAYGTLIVTLNAAIGSSSGIAAANPTGSVSTALGATTGASTGSLTVIAAGSPSLGIATSAATGSASETPAGVASAILTAATASGTGISSAAGGTAVSAVDASATATGGLEANGNVTASLPNATGTAEGELHACGLDCLINVTGHRIRVRRDNRHQHGQHSNRGSKRHGHRRNRHRGRGRGIAQ